MNATYTCSQCLRVLRRSLRAEKTKSPLNLKSQKPARHISTRAPLLQQQQEQSTPIPQPPPFIPTTTGTVTANITAPPPPNPPSKPSASLPKDGLSIAEMQHAITSTLGSSKRPDITSALASRIRKTAVKTTETYVTYGLTELLFKACSAQADYTIPEAQRTGLLTGKGPEKTAGGEDLGIPASDSESSMWWFRQIGLAPTFSTWSQVAYLHMYLLTVRLRGLEDTSAFQNYQRYLLEHFSHAAEEKMIILHGMSARGIRNRYLKDLFLQWRGLLAAYDEGLIRGDAVLAGAVWRNLFKGEEEVDWSKVAEVVVYIRRVVNGLGDVDLPRLDGKLTGKEGIFDISRRDLETVVSRKSPPLADVLSGAQGATKL